MNEGSRMQRKAWARGPWACGVVAMVIALATPTAGWACDPPPPPPPTEWVAGVSDWFVGTNWDNDVPTAQNAALINNWGEAQVADPCAVAEALRMGITDADGGTLTLFDGGSLRITGRGMSVGEAGFGTVLHEGGVLDIRCGDLFMAMDETAFGTYMLDAGELWVRGDEIIGDAGSGAFLQAAGKHVIRCGDMVLANQASSAGSYAMDSGELYVGGGIDVGVAGSGAFAQYAGDVTVRCGGLDLARAADSLGAYSIYDGTLSVGGGEDVGLNGFAAFDQSGGLHSVCGDLVLGRGADGDGAFSLFFGELTVWGCEVIGGRGNGTFSQFDGTHAICGSLIIGYGSDSVGTMGLLGGDLSCGDLVVGLCGEGWLDLASSDLNVMVEHLVVFGESATLTAVEGATITVKHQGVVNASTDPAALAGLEDLTVAFDGSGQGHGFWWWCRPRPATYEVAGQDLGADAAGFVDNFALGTLQVGGDEPANVVLVDHTDNAAGGGREALYAHNVIVGPDSTLHLKCGINVYCDGVIDIQGEVTGGSIIAVP